jgi:hypothetical protein
MCKVLIISISTNMPKPQLHLAKAILLLSNFGTGACHFPQDDIPGILLLSLGNSRIIFWLTKESPTST